ncbi:MAG: hypothetical protein FWH53_01130 [Leptospirales bacterium]|nr:hypothetical protein [Leptospirales bacterium]
MDIINSINIPSLIQQNKNILIIIGLVLVVLYAYTFIRYRKMKTSNKDYLKDHPDAAKIYLSTRALITSETVSVYTVDGEGPQSFTEKGKSGFYVIPGSRVVEMSYTYSRPGILYKNVTETIGPVKKELLVESGKSYLLGFDRENESFTFTEL